MRVSFDIALDDKGQVELSDDKFDVDGWLDMDISREHADGTIEKMSVEIHVQEMHRALAPFLQKYWENKEREL